MHSFQCFCSCMALQHHGIAATVLVVVSLIAVCCSGESDTSTQLLFTNCRQCSFEYRAQPPSTIYTT